jgi:hypothetical protein
VVAKGYNVCSGAEDLIRLPGRYAHNIGILTIDHGEAYILLSLEIAQIALQIAKPRLPAYISYCQNSYAHGVTSSVKAECQFGQKKYLFFCI